MNFLIRVNIARIEVREQGMRMATARHEISAMPYGQRPTPYTGAANPPAIIKACVNGIDRGTCTACEVRDLAFCEALPDGDLSALEATRKRIELGAGETLIYDGDPADCVFTLTRGCVRLVKLFADGRRQVVRFVMPGDSFGFLVSDIYGFSAEAVTPSEVCKFERFALERLCDRFPNLRKRMLFLARQELEEQQKHLLLLGRISLAERLAAFILHLAEADAECPEAVRLPMRRADIADFLGTTVETVARILTRFKRQGLIALPENNHVVFLDVEGLRELADAGIDDY